MNLQGIVNEIRTRLCRLFVAGDHGPAAWPGKTDLFRADPWWNYLTLFHEYFNVDTGAGCGAGHQTGWTALVSRLLAEESRTRHASVAPAP